jgi:hypothetical protein
VADAGEHCSRHREAFPMTDPAADPFGDRIGVVQDDPGPHDPHHPGHIPAADQVVEVERLAMAMRAWYGRQGDGDHPRTWIDDDAPGIAAEYAALRERANELRAAHPEDDDFPPLLERMVKGGDPSQWVRAAHPEEDGPR